MMDRRQQGVGMVEVLVALLVVAIGVLGYAGMQLFALQGSEESGYRAHATLIARDALERFLVNPDGVAVYMTQASWPTDPTPGGAMPVACLGVECDAAQMARADIAELGWIAANSLPAGLIMARDDCLGAPSLSCVVLSWQGTEPTDCVTGGVINQNQSCVVLEMLR